MKHYKNLLFYIVVISVFSFLIFWIFEAGRGLEINRKIAIGGIVGDHWVDFIKSLVFNLKHPLALLLAQIVTIIVVARFFGFLFKSIGQPTVIGEIIAGIVLGPTVAGYFFPGFSENLFPANSIDNLQLLSQVGLILFMFIVGMELDLKILKNKANDALVISGTSIIFPFTLGIGLAYFIYESFAPSGIKFSSFSLFIGIAMSITAFPVLARIVQERGMHRTRLGAVVITCAAADDITAWFLLAIVIAIVKAGSFVSALYIIALSLLYVLIMLKVVRPFLQRIGELHASRENLTKQIVAIFFLILILSSFATEVIGIHALFGAFIAGVIMPDNVKFRNIFIEKVEDIALVLLLPLFFVSTGLRTEIGLLNEWYLWQITGLIIMVAIIGKFFGSTLSAKFVGHNWKESLIIGALMNTRGLMQLVVLNIGFDLGVLTAEMFAMMVIMALVTTFMTGPALSIINRVFKDKESDKTVAEPILIGQVMRVLVSFGNPETGRVLLRLASNFMRKQEMSEATAVHFSPSTEMNHYNIVQYEKESFGPVTNEAHLLNQKINTIFKVSNDFYNDIIEEANNGKYNLLLIGIGQSIYEGSFLGRTLGYLNALLRRDRIIKKVTGKERLFEYSAFEERNRYLFEGSEIPVGVFVNKKFAKCEQLLLSIHSKSDIFLIDYALLIFENTVCNITIYDPLKIILSRQQQIQSLQRLFRLNGGKVNIVTANGMKKEQMQKHDLLLVSALGWKEMLDAKDVWYEYAPSTLILKDRSISTLN
jgi:Kef-type K+ transport system membrane component KefB